MAKIDDIYDSVDDFGLVTSAEAAELGMSNAELVQQARMGRLVRVARGVYRMPVWPSQPAAPYAVAVRAAGEGACLYGESVAALLGLAPTDPAKIWVAVPRRTRRDLGRGVRLVLAPGIEPVWYEGVACQPVAGALVAAATTMGRPRALEAAREALRLGYVAAAEADRIERELGE
jgi:predicted transcriptional regulator of viral defense system